MFSLFIKKKSFLLSLFSLFIAFSITSCTSESSDASSSSEPATGKSISGTLKVTGSKTIAVGATESYTLDLSGVKPATILTEVAAGKTVSLKFKETVPTGVTIEEVNLATTSFKIKTTASTPVTASKTYTVVMKVDGYDDSVEASLDLEIVAAVSPQFSLTSSKSDGGFDDGNYIDSSFIANDSSGTHGNFPKMSWKNVPEGTTYFVLIFQRDDQKDASAFQRTGHGLWVIPKDVTSLPKAAGVSRGRGEAVVTTSGVTGLERFIAPTSHTGTSRFKLYAVDYTSLAAITNALRGDLDNDGSIDTGKKSLYNADPSKNGHNGGSITGLSTDRIVDLESYLSGHILESSELTFKTFYNLLITAGSPGVKNTATAGTNAHLNDFANVVSRGVLKQEYGYDYENSKGELDFPVITVRGDKTNGTVSRFLIYQDEDAKSWGHGIWIVDPAQTSFGKAEGSPTFTGPQVSGGHASISGKPGVKKVIEAYYAPTPPPSASGAPVPLPHSYKFYIFDTSMSEADLETELNKIKAGGDGNSSAADRVSEIKKLLRDKILQEASFGFDYPKQKS